MRFIDGAADDCTGLSVESRAESKSVMSILLQAPGSGRLGNNSCL